MNLLIGLIAEDAFLLFDQLLTVAEMPTAKHAASA